MSASSSADGSGHPISPVSPVSPIPPTSPLGDAELSRLELLVHKAQAADLKSILSEVITTVPGALPVVKLHLGITMDDSISGSPHTQSPHAQRSMPRSRSFDGQSSPLELSSSRQERTMSLATRAKPKDIRLAKKAAKLINGHKFKAHSWKPHETCDVCQLEMKGRLFGKQGVLCATCTVKCHAKCQRETVQCPSSPA
eukprot:m.87915 g.87915  ORF g.87915 m.87915 type:complete len:198 (+) comp12844_c0_seq5:117-710(+)